MSVHREKRMQISPGSGLGLRIISILINTAIVSLCDNKHCVPFIKQIFRGTSITMRNGTVDIPYNQWDAVYIRSHFAVSATAICRAKFFAAPP